MSILFHNKGQIVQLSNDTISYVMELWMESIWFIGISDERSEITEGPEIPCILRGGIIRNMTALSKMYPLMISRLNIRRRTWRFSYSGFCNHTRRWNNILRTGV